MEYEQYMKNLIDQTGARNYVEARMIETIREHWPHRHRVTTTSSGRSMKVDLYWVKRTIKEIRSYRKWLDWCEKTRSEIPMSREAISGPFQLRLFSREG